MLDYNNSFSKVFEYFGRKICNLLPDNNARHDELMEALMELHLKSRDISEVSLSHDFFLINEEKVKEDYKDEVSFFYSDLFRIVTTGYFNNKIDQLDNLNSIEKTVREILQLKPQERDLIKMYEENSYVVSTIPREERQLRTTYYCGNSIKFSHATRGIFISPNDQNIFKLQHTY